MEFASPTKWPNRTIKAGGSPLGLGTLRAAELTLRDAESRAPREMSQKLQDAENGKK